MKSYLPDLIKSMEDMYYLYFLCLAILNLEHQNQKNKWVCYKKDDVV